jgi:hypothetical protein
MPSLPFDRVVVVEPTGGRREMSAREFLDLPLHTRVRHVLDRSIEFFAGAVVVARREALAGLRQIG